MIANQLEFGQYSNGVNCTLLVDEFLSLSGQIAGDATTATAPTIHGENKTSYDPISTPPPKGYYALGIGLCVVSALLIGVAVSLFLAAAGVPVPFIAAGLATANMLGGISAGYGAIALLLSMATFGGALVSFRNHAYQMRHYVQFTSFAKPNELSSDEKVERLLQANQMATDFANEHNLSPE